LRSENESVRPPKKVILSGVNERKEESMEVLMLNGSPRGPKSVTGALLDSLGEGLTEGGASVVKFRVAAMKISPCSGCLSCMHKKPGECVIRDDMALIYDRARVSDLMVVGTPVYTDTMTAQMKAVMDRFLCSLQPFLIKDESGKVRHPHWWPMPGRYMLVSTSGFPEKETFAPLIATFRAEAVNAGADPIAEVCVPGSIALQMEPAKLERHRAIVREFGRSLALTGKVDPMLLSELNTPPFTTDEFLAYSAKYESWCREKLNIAADGGT
jgi:hypothetical protein